MNDPNLTPDNPQLTAYALGELEGDERAAVEAAVRADPALRAVVEEIRATALTVQSALAAEAAGGLPEETWERPASRGREASAYDGGRSRRLLRFPQFYYVTGGLAAACLAMIVALNHDEYEAREQVRAEQLRVALEKRAAASRQAVALPRVVVVNEDASAPAAGAEELRGPAHAALTPSPTRPAFAANHLGLLEQVQPASAPASSANVAQAEPARPEASAPRIAGSAADTPPAPDAAAGASSESTRVAASAPTELVPEPQAVFVAPATSASPTGAYASAADAGPEVVTLSAFQVAAKRVGALTAASAQSRRWATYDPLRDEHDYRPRAPAGARFARSPGAVVRDNDFLRAAQHPVSTFSVDTETASYVTMRRMIARHELPPRELVKIEEFLNYFPYRYAPPAPPRTLSFLERLGGDDGAPPVAASLEVAEAPWAPAHRLVRVGLKAREVGAVARPAANLVFLVDVSRSMNEPNRLPLVKESLRLLLGKLRGDDRIAIVTYAGASGLALPPTRVEQAQTIAAAVEALSPSPSDNGSAGIRLAYEVARQSFAEDGINRVILCTDGDFNLGPASETELLRLVADKAGTGVFLTVLGFGMGNYKDQTLESLAELGNGTYGYIDSRREAQKLLVEQVSSTLVTVAKDVKVQVEFNPAKVSSYRLIGYENRLLRREDFNTDEIDAGELGAGHTVTALYEVVPVAAGGPAVTAYPPRHDLKYSRYGAEPAPGVGRFPVPAGEDASGELLTVKVRYKKPDGFFSRLSEFPLTDRGAKFAQASADFRFAAAVAQLGMILRASPHRGAATIGDVIAWAAAAAANPADDPGGYRGEFIDLARQAQEILRTE